MQGSEGPRSVQGSISFLGNVPRLDEATCIEMHPPFKLFRNCQIHVAGVVENATAVRAGDELGLRLTADDDLRG